MSEIRRERDWGSRVGLTCEGELRKNKEVKVGKGCGGDGGEESVCAGNVFLHATELGGELERCYSHRVQDLISL